jgi:hypothetical protein
MQGREILCGSLVVGSGEAVANSRFSSQKSRRGWVRFNFFAEMGEVDPQIGTVLLGLWTPDLPQDLTVG